MHKLCAVIVKVPDEWVFDDDDGDDENGEDDDDDDDDDDDGNGDDGDDYDSVDDDDVEVPAVTSDVNIRNQHTDSQPTAMLAPDPSLRTAAPIPSCLHAPSGIAEPFNLYNPTTAHHNLLRHVSSISLQLTDAPAAVKLSTASCSQCGGASCHV
jgi:hypothetical protein